MSDSAFLLWEESKHWRTTLPQCASPEHSMTRFEQRRLWRYLLTQIGPVTEKQTFLKLYSEIRRRGIQGTLFVMQKCWSVAYTQQKCSVLGSGVSGRRSTLVLEDRWFAKIENNSWPHAEFSLPQAIPLPWWFKQELVFHSSGGIAATWYNCCFLDLYMATFLLSCKGESCSLP